MANFSSLFKTAAGEAKKPQPLPIGEYVGMIKSFERKDGPAGKDYKEIVRFNLVPLEWPSDVDEASKSQDLGHGPIPIDLTKRQLRRDFYDNSLHRLDDFIRSCGIEPKGREYGEVIPEMIGKRVKISIGQYINQQTNEYANQVNDLTGE